MKYLIALLLSVSPTVWAQLPELDRCFSMGLLNSEPTQYVKLVSHKYRMATKGGEFELTISGFDKNNRGSASFTTVPYGSEDYEDAFTDTSELESIPFSRLRVSKDNRTLTFIDTETVVKFKLIVELNEPLTHGRLNIKNFRLTSSDNRRWNVYSAQVTRGEFYFYPDRPQRIHLSGDLAKEVLIRTPEGLKFISVYRGLIGSAEPAANVYEIKGNFSALEFINLQHGLRALGLRKDHPILIVQRPDQMGLGKFKH